MLLTDRTPRVGVYGVARRGAELLLVVQKSGPYKEQFDLPGGKIEFGEGIEQALRREFLEEVGMEFDSLIHLSNLSVFHPTYSLHQIALIYSVDGLRISEQKGSLEHHWVKIDTIQKHSASPFVWESLHK